MKHLLPLFALFSAGFAQTAVPPLDRPVGQVRVEKAPLAATLRSLGRSVDVNLIIDADVTGDVTAEVSSGTLRTALTALTQPGGYCFEESLDGIAIRNRRTVLYMIDYPQLTRSGSGSASITLGANGTNQANANVPATLATANSGLAGNVSDATQVQVSQENQNTFWTGLEAELKTMLKEGDSLVLNRFSGVAQVTAPNRRQEVIRAFIELVNHRITQQVEIEARLVEVTLRDEQKLGVDWELAAAKVGSVSVGGAEVPLQIADVGGATLSPNTFAANLGFGRASAVISALKQQGEVKTVAQPRLRALNNQTAFIKVGEDRPFFRLQQSTSFQQAGTNNPVNQTQESFSVSTITIGTILAVTPQIDSQGVITLDVLPAITRLQSIVTSPDGRQTAPVTEVKQASTIVRLKDGETAVIGGLIAEESGETTRSVPGLGSVPVVGRAFKSKAALRTRTELVIFLTPKLVR